MHNSTKFPLFSYIFHPFLTIPTTHTPFLTAPARAQIFHRGAPGVTGVHWTAPEISRGAPQPIRNANLVEVEISALRSDWGAPRAYEKRW